MLNPNPSEHISRIKIKLRTLGQEQITGARLGELIRDLGVNVREAVKIPTGTGALTKFISIYLSDILVECGKKGSDILYNINLTSEGALDNLGEKYLWPAFVKPSSKLKISVNQENEITISNEVNGKREDKEIEIRSATTEELDNIRTEFIQHVVGCEAEHVENLGVEIPYVDWVRNLKNTHPEKSKQWGKYRFDKIVELFEKKAIAAGIAKTNVTALSDKLRKSQNEIYNEKTLGKHQPTEIQTTHRHIELVETLRSSIIYAVERMSQNELRELKIPAGLLVDAFFESEKSR